MPPKLTIGDYVRNIKTRVRGAVKVIYKNAPLVLVIRHQSDGFGSRWQTWYLDETELMGGCDADTT